MQINDFDKLKNRRKFLMLQHMRINQEVYDLQVLKRKLSKMDNIADEIDIPITDRRNYLESERGGFKSLYYQIKSLKSEVENNWYKCKEIQQEISEEVRIIEGIDEKLATVYFTDEEMKDMINNGGIRSIKLDISKIKNEKFNYKSNKSNTQKNYDDFNDLKSRFLDLDNEEEL